MMLSTTLRRDEGIGKEGVFVFWSTLASLRLGERKKNFIGDSFCREAGPSGTGGIA